MNIYRIRWHWIFQIHFTFLCTQASTICLINYIVSEVSTLLMVQIYLHGKILFGINFTVDALSNLVNVYIQVFVFSSISLLGGFLPTFVFPQERVTIRTIMFCNIILWQTKWDDAAWDASENKVRKNKNYEFDWNYVATKSLIQFVPNLPKYTQTGTKCPSQRRGACFCSCRHMMLAMETS